MEEIGLIFEFLERTQSYRNSNEILKNCILKITEVGVAGHEVSEELAYDSWESMKEEYPTFKDLLISLFGSDNWNADWRGGNRVLYAEKVIGHEGLYNDIDAVASYEDYQEE